MNNGRPRIDPWGNSTFQCTPVIEKFLCCNKWSRFLSSPSTSSLHQVKILLSFSNLLLKSHELLLLIFHYRHSACSITKVILHAFMLNFQNTVTYIYTYVQFLPFSTLATGLLSVVLSSTFFFTFYLLNYQLVNVLSGTPLWSSGQSFWLQIQRFRVRFPALPDFLSGSGSGTGCTQPREPCEVNWGATWIK